MCPNACSGRGFCNIFNVCACTTGFWGSDCSNMRCPMGKAWGVITGTDTAHQMAECSGRGICNPASGTCSCQIGFEGHACEYVICQESCSGRGRCITMEQLASNPLVALNLYDRPTPYSYSPYVMWDADMLRGCLCDQGYTGYNCLLNQCHLGDDPLTAGQTEEVQLVACTASYLQHTITLNYDAPLTAGTFVLQFGLERTSPISFNAPAANALGTSMTEMLQTLSTIPSAVVTRSTAATSTSWSVTFPQASTQQHNFQPLWRVMEVQTFFCAADSGFLTLQYNKYLFGNIPFSALASDLKATLESCSKIGAVQVSYSQGLMLCQAGGNQVTITFQTMLDRNFIGDLPSLLIDSTNQAQRNGLFLGGLLPVVDSAATEVIKGIDTCNQVEVQSFVCGASSGLFSLSFEGRTLANIPFSIAAADLKSQMLGTFTSLKDIDITYSSGDTACDPIGAGTTVTISFVIATTLGPRGNGDLGSITTDMSNGGVSGLAHSSPNLLQLSPTATELTKGARCVPLSSSYFVAPRQQMTSTVIQGGGTFTLTFRGYTTTWIPAVATPAQVAQALVVLPSIKNITVTFSTGEACAMPPNIIRLNFTQEFGNLPTVTAQGNNVQVQVYSSGAVEPTTSVASIDGTKESQECSGRGSCAFSTGGHCRCYTGYQASDGRGNPATFGMRRDDCGSTSTTIASCPGDIPCSGHGTCGSSFKCTCAVGWRNGDCSERTCPFGLSWFSYPSNDNVAHRDLAECSNAGLCDRVTGLCQCSSPFTGPACAWMGCGGSPTPCSGHGQCLNLRELAPLVKINGVQAGFTFGDDPNNPLTWEAEKIHSCLCDFPFFGHDCSLVKCPRGDDPNTYLDVPEVQHLHCTASGGSFTVTFREKTTPSIPYNANLQTLKQALETIIQRVNLAFSSSNTMVCSPQGVVTTITFVYDLGALPCLQADNSPLIDAVNGNGALGSGNLVVNCQGATLLQTYVSVVGTRENAVCSNHGDCDTNTGTCKCDPFFASSDGLGGPGLRGDCGYRVVGFYN
ncbi:unnamed protein product [Aphanomyces euteiches]